MAEFCRQCTYEIFSEEGSDLDHFGRGKPPLKPGYGYSCICEGCGYIYVDDTGSCITKDCLHPGHPRYTRDHPNGPLPPRQEEPEPEAFDPDDNRYKWPEDRK